ncbi:hypothetical protein ACHAWF_017671, partial [Thalassiosira exigua]
PLALDVAGGGGEEEEEEEEEQDDPDGSIFQCDWSERIPGTALELLLRRMEGDRRSFLEEGGYVPRRDEEGEGKQGESDEDEEEDEEEEEEEEALLLSATHASEVLVAIIQSSLPDAPATRELSSPSTLGRIVDLVVVAPPEGEGGEEEGGRRSGDREPGGALAATIASCAASVLEALCLQLGGYGTVVASVDAGVPPEGVAGTSAGGDTAGSSSADGPTSPSTDGPTSPATGPPASAALRPAIPALLPRLSAALGRPPSPAPFPWTARTRRRPRSELREGDAEASFPPVDVDVVPRPRLGPLRLRVLRLIESLVLLGDPVADFYLSKSDVLAKATELFWRHEWHGALHQCVANLVVHVVEGGADRSVLQEHLLLAEEGGCDWVGRLMGAFEEEDADRARPDANGDGDNDVPSSPPRYGEMVRAMKRLCQDEGGDDEPGEVVAPGPAEDAPLDAPNQPKDEDEDEEEDVVAPATEDDVDSAMEREESRERGEDDDDDEHEDPPLPLPGDDASGRRPPSPRPEARPARGVRKGYMGHVVIVCQALVRACEERDGAGVEGTDGDAAQPPPDELDALTRHRSGSGHNGSWDDRNDPLDEDEDEDYDPYPELPSLGSPPSLDEICDEVEPFSSAMEFETSAPPPPPLPPPPSSSSPPKGDSPHPASGNSKKRKDTSPPRRGGDVDEDEGGRFPSDAPAPPPPSPSRPVGATMPPSSSVERLLRRHPLGDRWRTFASTTLAEEVAVQVAPLGGVRGGGDDGAPSCAGGFGGLGGFGGFGSGLGFGGTDANGPVVESIEDDGDAEFLGCGGSAEEAGGSSSGSYANRCPPGAPPNVAIAAEFDLDEHDLDVAASMMEQLSLPPPRDDDGAGGGPPSHRRRRPPSSATAPPCPLGDAAGSGSGASRSRGIGGFGSVLGGIGGGKGFEGYVYDDPLGGAHPFDDDGDGGGGTSSPPSSSSDKFLAGAVVLSRDGTFEGRTSSPNGGDDGEGEADDDDEDDDVPILDLFAGAFEPDFANFDALVGEGSPSATTGAVPDVAANPFGRAEESGNGDGFDAPAAGGGDGGGDDDPGGDPFGSSRTPFDLAADEDEPGGDEGA